MALIKKVILNNYGRTIYTNTRKNKPAFNFLSLTPNVTGVIDETNHTISLSIPFNTDVTNLTPTIMISDKASVAPNNNTAQNFTNPVTYVVTAEDGFTQNYTVTVTIAPEDTTVTQLKIITLPQTINVDTISNIITVQTQNAAKEDKKVSKTTHLILSSSSVTGEFSSNSTNWNPVTTLTMNTGWANRNFYYKDSTPGTPTITISTDGLSSDSKIITILPLSPT